MGDADFIINSIFVPPLSLKEILFFEPDVYENAILEQLPEQERIEFIRNIVFGVSESNLNRAQAFEDSVLVRECFKYALRIEDLSGSKSAFITSFNFYIDYLSNVITKLNIGNGFDQLKVCFTHLLQVFSNKNFLENNNESCVFVSLIKQYFKDFVSDKEVMKLVTCFLIIAGYSLHKQKLVYIDLIELGLSYIDMENLSLEFLDNLDELFNDKEFCKIWIDCFSKIIALKISHRLVNLKLFDHVYNKIQNMSKEDKGYAFSKVIQTLKYNLFHSESKLFQNKYQFDDIKFLIIDWFSPDLVLELYDKYYHPFFDFLNIVENIFLPIHHFFTFNNNYYEYNFLKDF